MNETDEKELRELDAWIAEHVFDAFHHPEFHQAFQGNNQNKIWWIESVGEEEPFSPTTDQFYSFALLKKCAEKTSTIKLYSNGVAWMLDAVKHSDGVKKLIEIHAEAETLEIAVARFSKLLFS